MGKSKVFILSIVVALLFHVELFAGETYSKWLGGIGTGDISACVSDYCIDDDSEIKLDTDNSWMFQVVPIAYKTAVVGNLELAMEPTFFVASREFDAEYEGNGYNLMLDGRNTDYGFMGNLIARWKMERFVPYAGAGIGVKHTSYDVDFSCSGYCSFDFQADPHSDFVRVWTLLAGVELPVMGNLKGNLQYQYMGSDRYRDIAISSQANANLDGEHVFSLGFTF